MNHWLFKSEPDTFSIKDLEERGSEGEVWDGVRNYQARNFLRDDCRVGDRVLFYHSSCKIPGVAGEAKVVEIGIVDPTQFDETSNYFDPKATKEKPRWHTVRVAFVKEFKNIIPLTDLKQIRELNRMQLLKPGNRLSVLPIKKAEYEIIKKLA